MSSTSVARRPSYAAVLRIPHARRTFAAALLGRLSYGVVPLSLMLAVTRSSGSYAVAGTVMALFSGAAVFLSPVRASLIDRHGPRAALVPMVTAYAALLTVLTALIWRPGTASPVVLGAVTAAAGACTPPLGPTMRAVWGRLAPDRALLQRAYSLDGVAEELLFVSGPLLVGVLVGSASPAAGLAVGTGLMLTGTAAFVTSPAVAGVGPAGREERVREARDGLAAGREAGDRSSGAGEWAREVREGLAAGLVAGNGSFSGPGARARTVRDRLAAGLEAGNGLAAGWVGGRRVLRRLFPGPGGRGVCPTGVQGGIQHPRRAQSAGVLRRVLQPVVAVAGVGLALGLADLVVVAFVEQRHHGDDAVAWTLAALSAGSAVGGLLNGAVAWSVPARTRLPLSTVGLGLALLGAGLAPGLGTLALALAVAGFFVAPTLTTAYLVADNASAPEARVRAGTWVNTAVNAGLTAGGAVAGHLVDALPTGPCFATAGAAALLTALATARGARERNTPRRVLDAVALDHR
ncbi:MFS transporter [Streptomyces cylindrosporus]|uniref:MFS transporter n=1 Tax=Streptomyces cylindrosporus TaxID=2927583 RepID=A0ABS9Y968_9ACTN|nr:MFS transporter [Streptomyces cylindrosporus]MCI3273161.1 MFS transporter [Streptomyces cylindrosporus]